MKKCTTPCRVLIILLFVYTAVQGQTVSKLPIFQECQENPFIHDDGVEFDKLESFDEMTYAHAYQMIFSNSDSLQVKRIRDINSKNSRLTVKHILPTVHFLPDSILKSKNYNDIMKNTSDIKWYSRKKKSVENLLVNTEKGKQLFIEVKSYIHDPKFKNYITVFVFDTKNSELLYFDEVQYYCDIRDKDAFIKVLAYALNKLKQFKTD